MLISCNTFKYSTSTIKCKNVPLDPGESGRTSKQQPQLLALPMWACHLVRCFLAVSVIVSPNVTISDQTYKSFTSWGFQVALVNTHK